MDSLSEKTFWEDSLGKKWDLTLSLATARRIDAQNWEPYIKEEEFRKTFTATEGSEELFRLLRFNRNFAAAIGWLIIFPEYLQRDGQHLDSIPKEEFDKLYEQGEQRFLEQLKGPSLLRLQRGLVDAFGNFTPEWASLYSALNQEIDEALKQGMEKIKEILPQLRKSMLAEVGASLPAEFGETSSP